MTREDALDVLNIASTKRIQIKRIEEKILTGRRGLQTLDEMRSRVIRLQAELVKMRDQRREAMKVLGGY